MKRCFTSLKSLLVFGRWQAWNQRLNLHNIYHLSREIYWRIKFRVGHAKSTRPINASMRQCNHAPCNYAFKSRRLQEGIAHRTPSFPTSTAVSIRAGPFQIRIESNKSSIGLWWRLITRHFPLHGGRQ